MHIGRWTIPLIPMFALHADIHKCQTDHGYIFTDTHCTSGTLVHKTKSHHSFETGQGLSEMELRTLAELDKQYELYQRSASQKRQQAAKQRRMNAVSRTENCTEANRELSRIETIRRSGYKLKEARGLDARQMELQLQKRENC